MGLWPGHAQSCCLPRQLRPHRASAGCRVRRGPPGFSMHLSIRRQCDANHRMRPPNAELRRREHLTEAEVERLKEAAKGNRYALGIRWNSRTATLHVRRVRRAPRARTRSSATSCGRCGGSGASQVRRSVFTSERGALFTTAGFARMVERVGSEAKLGFKAHPHMLRHACGYALANKGHDTRALQAYLGHRNIQHTVRYTELSPTRFKDFWRS